MIKAAIIGFGKSARVFHIPLVQTISEIEVTALVSSKINEVKKIFPRADVYDKIEDLLKDNSINLVIITTPNSLHYSQVKASLLAGKHVVVEKPFVINPAEGEELAVIAKKSNLKLAIYHNRRWDNGILTLKELIANNILGDIYHYEVRYDRWRPNIVDRWRERDEPGSGTLYDLGSHMIDQALYLFGKPDEVIADIQKQRPGAVATDYFHLVFKYADCNRRVILHSSCLARNFGSHIVVHGSKATFVQNSMDPQEEMLMKGFGPNSPDWGKAQQEDTFLYYYDKQNELIKEPIKPELGSYEKFYKLMVEAILYDKPVPVSAEEAVDVISYCSLFSEAPHLYKVRCTTGNF